MPKHPTGRTAPKGGGSPSASSQTPTPKPAPVKDDPRKYSEYDNGVYKSEHRYPRNVER